jgi:predicted enzyme related to lactoylglutathione lyase
MSEATATVGSVMLDCNDVDVMVTFWGQLLGLEEKVRFPGYAWMSRMTKGGQSLAFQQVPEPKTGKNRMHLDMASTDPEAFVARVQALGGNRLQDHEISGFEWTVCSDPEGNEFCVTKAE